jgi:hypothetical protein
MGIEIGNKRKLDISSLIRSLLIYNCGFNRTLLMTFNFIGDLIGSPSRGHLEILHNTRFVSKARPGPVPQRVGGLGPTRLGRLLRVSRQSVFRGVEIGEQVMIKNGSELKSFGHNGRFGPTSLLTVPLDVPLDS